MAVQGCYTFTIHVVRKSQCIMLHVSRNSWLSVDVQMLMLGVVLYVGLQAY